MYENHAQFLRDFSECALPDLVACRLFEKGRSVCAFGRVSNTHDDVSDAEGQLRVSRSITIQSCEIRCDRPRYDDLSISTDIWGGRTKHTSDPNQLAFLVKRVFASMTPMY